MTARGVVARASAGRVEIELAAQSACRGCEGWCSWRRLSAAQRIELAADGPFAVGDQVVIALPPRYVLLGTLLVHGLPLTALLGGALAGLAFGASDMAALLGAGLGLALAIGAARPIKRRLEALTLRALAVARESH